MAITTNSTIRESAAELPIGYTPPVLPTITEQAEENYTVDLSIALADPATPATGIANILTALETDFTTTQVPRLSLDAAGTFIANLEIVTVTRVNTQDSIFVAGTEVYRCVVSSKWD